MRLLPVLNLTWVENRGITFGLLNGAGSFGPVLLTWLALAVVAALVGWLWRAERVLVAVALGAIIGGALGNNVIRPAAARLRGRFHPCPCLGLVVVCLQRGRRRHRLRGGRAGAGRHLSPDPPHRDSGITLPTPQTTAKRRSMVPSRLLLAAALLPLALAGCGNNDLSRTFGMTRDAPDEFQVTTRAPLSMPPDFMLRPPRPGAPRPQEMSPRQEAEATLAPQAALAGRRAAPSAPASRP